MQYKHKRIENPIKKLKLAIKQICRRNPYKIIEINKLKLYQVI